MSDTPTTDTGDVLDLRELLSKPASEFPDLPDLPANRTFYGKLINIMAGVSSQKQTPYFRLGVRLTDPGKDVTDAEINKIKNAGFSLADYNVWADFYLTPNAMKMFRRFLDTLGFPDSIPLKEMLKLNEENLGPTDETQELFRGKDVIVRTGQLDEKGRIYNRLDQIAGVTRD